MANIRTYDIYVLGIGIKWIDHITLETDRILGACKEILYVERGLGIDAYFKTKSSAVTDLTQLYSENTPREQTYIEMATQVIAAAMRNSPVAFALYGHPTVFAYPPFLVKRLAFELGLRVKVLPGVSALDCLMTDLLVDPAVNGMQMYEATDLVLRDHSISPYAAMVIWQIGSLETALFSSARSAEGRFKNIKKKLLSVYPETHQIYAVYSQPHPALKSQIHQFPLSAIEDYADVLHSAVTLYLPPVEPAPVLHWDVVEKLNDVSHLRSITQS